ncbi:MAG: FGGY family carbohydrate kinase, partial [Chloroflexota bacterium]|nr:FGGY family carbohydrate kinase [Chloroflexota bacterium]
MQEKYLLGVDIGTYSSKGVLVETHTGEIIAEHAIEHGLETPHPGWAEHDADQVWWREFAEICRALIQDANISPQRIACVGVSALGACILPIDAAGNPLRKAILYGIDTRATDEIQELESVFSKEKIFDIAGMHLSTQSTGPKILWIKNHEPEVFEQAACFLTSQAYIVHRLTGAATLDYFTMADFSPMMDIRRKRWHKETTEYITPIDKLPEPSWSCEIAGGVTEEAAKETGLVPGTKVIVGTTDAGAEMVSACGNKPGDMMMMFGSSFFFVMLTEKLLPSEKFWATPWLDASSYALQGGTSTAGSLTRWFRDNFAPVEVAAQKAGGELAYAALAKLLDESPPGAKGLISLPYFEGERTPIYDPLAKGTIFGLSLHHTRADIYRSMLEGIAFGIRNIIDNLLKLDAKPQRFIGVSGGTKNHGWMQITADIANIEIELLNKSSSAPYGDAFMAA